MGRCSCIVSAPAVNLTKVSFLRNCRLFAEGEKGWPGLGCGDFLREVRASSLSVSFPECGFFRVETLNLDIRVDMMTETLVASPRMMGEVFSVLRPMRGTCVRHSRNSS